MPAAICLVTEELSLGSNSGGIGGAFHEMALALRATGHPVDILYVPISHDANESVRLSHYYEDRGIHVIRPDLGQHAWEPSSYEKRSYGIFRHLLGSSQRYDIIHFHDYKGLGFSCLTAKRQRLAFAETCLLVQAHGPTRWTLEANHHPFSHEDQLTIDFMERESIARADVLTAPSRYMIDWLERNGFSLPPPDRVRVIQNISLHLASLLGDSPVAQQSSACNEIILFGRHEDRKGIVPFCDSLDIANEVLTGARVLVTFLGPFGTVNGEASPLYLAHRAHTWQFPLRLLPDLDRLSACRYLAGNPRATVFVPSPFENSPYTVLEAALAGRAVVTSVDGGARELLDPSVVTALTCQIERKALADRLVEAVQTGLPAARLAVSPAETARTWCDLHERIGGTAQGAMRVSSRRPKVVAAITHHERPGKLFDSMMSLATQTYPNLEIVIVDDGSTRPDTLLLLERLGPLMDKLNIRLLRQSNRYLGAARNHAVANTKSDYILFLDDDDIAFPNLVQTLVTAAEATQAAVVNCLNLFMPESRRGQAHPFPERFVQKVSYAPIGGPLSVAPLQNAFGAATALIRRDALATVGGYTEQYGVGHEDFELYARMLQSGLKIEVCPFPLYLYQVDHAGMISSTSSMRNWNRVVNAIKIIEQPAAWRDFISVAAGKRALEHAENFSRYKSNFSPHKDLLAKLVEQPQDTARYAELLADFASATSAPGFAVAARDLAAARAAAQSGSDTTTAAASMDVPARSPVPSAPSDVLTLAALIDLSFGRIAEAIAAFAVSWERGSASIAPAQLRFLRALAISADLLAEQAEQLFALLSRPHDMRAEIGEVTAVKFRLALRGGNVAAAANLLDHVTALEEQEYLALNQDVGGAVVGQVVGSGLAHFVRDGMNEGRSGFVAVLDMQDALQIHLGERIPLELMQKRLRQPVANGTTGHERGNGSLHPPRGTRRMPRRGAAKSRSAERSAEH
jgi:GT2 family glycosyltransferase/glycosyltransferase involved in cell wall biosynthesis